MSAPRVSVVILSRNRSRDLGIVLEHTRNLSSPAKSVEMIVVDNGSTDGTQSFLSEQRDVHSIFHRDNMGISGWNDGFDAAGGDWFLALDDDCYLESDGLAKALQAAAEEKADLVSFLVRDPQRPAFVFNRLYDTGLLSFWGCAVLVNRRVIQSIGGFDRNILVWGHELEFMLRFFDAGFRHLYLPEVTAFHMNKPSYSDYKFLTNHRHMAYIAGSRLPGISGLRAMTALFVPIADGFGRRPLAPLYWRLARATLGGYFDGRRRHYRPVKVGIAQVYVRHFADFSLPLRIRPALRLAWPDRRKYFPALLERASLRLVGHKEV
jgi:GT2 family glycosyltransferase